MYRYTDIYMYIYMPYVVVVVVMTANDKHSHTHTIMSNNAGNPREFTNYQSRLSRWALKY